MPNLIEALPGIRLPVGEVTERLATMWEAGPGASPSEFRASQMNVVLHFGLDVTPEEGRKRFDALLQFAQRYPSRIIVLCPAAESRDGSMEAKLFSQCYIGESHREMCCCEALLLGYKSEDSGFLSNQVSVWLEGDLPTYHWFSGVPPERIKKYFEDLLVGVRRCIFDSSVEPDSIRDLDWPEPERVSDLARARLLPARQAIGQFLSGYALDQLCDGLEQVEVKHAPAWSGEGRRLLEWFQDCLTDCEQRDKPVRFKLTEDQSEDASPIAADWVFKDERYFSWRKNREGSLGEIKASLGKGEQTIPTRIKNLAPEQVLAEALFF